MALCRTFHTAPVYGQRLTPIVPHFSGSGPGPCPGTGHSQCDYTIMAPLVIKHFVTLLTSGKEAYKWKWNSDESFDQFAFLYFRFTTSRWKTPLIFRMMMKRKRNLPRGRIKRRNKGRGGSVSLVSVMKKSRSILCSLYPAWSNSCACCYCIVK